MWGIVGTSWDHPRGSSSISRSMGGQEKKSFFSDFVLYSLLYREFPRAESGKSLFLLQPPKIYCPCFVECNEFCLLFDYEYRCNFIKGLAPLWISIFECLENATRTDDMSCKTPRPFLTLTNKVNPNCLLSVLFKEDEM